MPRMASTLRSSFEFKIRQSRGRALRAVDPALDARDVDLGEPELAAREVAAAEMEEDAAEHDVQVEARHLRCRIVARAAGVQRDRDLGRPGMAEVERNGFECAALRVP